MLDTIMTANGSMKKAIMTERLETILEKVSAVPSPINEKLIEEFYQFMVDNRKSGGYKKNNPKAPMLFIHELPSNVAKGLCQSRCKLDYGVINTYYFNRCNGEREQQ